MKVLDGPIRSVEGGVEIDVQVVPRASRDAVVGRVGDRIKVSITAPPVDGRANDAIVELFATKVGAAKRDIVLVRGATAKRKTIRIAGITAEQVAHALEL
jgi:uncharacterized protein (TIGR00251 family)